MTAGQGAIVRDGDHAIALEAAVLEAFTIGAPCRRKANLAAGGQAARCSRSWRRAPGDAVVIDLGAWADLVPEGGR